MDDRVQQVEPTGVARRARSLAFVVVAAALTLVLVATGPAGAATMTSWGVPGDVGQPAALAFRLAAPSDTGRPGAIAVPDRIVRESNKYRASRQKLCVHYGLESWRMYSDHEADPSGPVDWYEDRGAGSCVWISAQANRTVMPGTWFVGLAQNTSYRVHISYDWFLPSGRHIGSRDVLLDRTGDYQCRTGRCFFGQVSEPTYEGDPGGLHVT